jgi:hypothetical protein
VFVTLLLNLVFWWITAWFFLQAQPEISTPVLIFFTLATALLYLAAYLLLPGRTVEELEVGQAKFELPGTPFFACLLAHYGTMSAYAMITAAGRSETRPASDPGILLLGAIVVLSAVENP